MKKIITLLVCLSAFTALSAQSPWAQAKGGGYAQLAYQIIPEYTDFFTGIDDSTRVSQRPYTDAGIQLYGEYGILNNTTIIVNAPFKMLNSGAADGLALGNEGSLSKLGNISVAVKQQFLNDPLAIALTLEAELPTGAYDESNGLRTGYDALSIIPKVSVGIGMDKFYAYARGGVAIRNNDYSNHLMVGAEAGYRFFNRLWFMLDADVYNSFEDGTRTDPLINSLSGFYVNDQEWVAFSAKLLFNITPRLGVLGTSTIGIISANNVPMSPHFSGGVFYNWQGRSNQ